MEGEIASDLSALHRVDDMYRMGSRRWAQLVPRLFAYTGAVQMKINIESAAARQTETAPGPTPSEAGGGVGLPEAPPSPMVGGKQIGSSQAELQFSDIGDMFSFG